MLERVDNALLDRGNVISRPPPAGDPFLERKSRAARQRLDLEHDVAVLAVSAGLFLVPAALGNRFADRFAITDALRAAFDGHAVAVAQPLGGDPQMHLALAPQHAFVGFALV